MLTPKSTVALRGTAGAADRLYVRRARRSINIHKSATAGKGGVEKWLQKWVEIGTLALLGESSVCL